MSSRSKKESQAGSKRQKKPATPGQPLTLSDDTSSAEEPPTMFIDQNKPGGTASTSGTGGYSVRPRQAAYTTDKINTLTDKINSPDSSSETAGEIEDLEEVVVLLDESPGSGYSGAGEDRAESVGMMSHNPMNTEFIPDSTSAGGFATESLGGGNVTEMLELGNLPELGQVEDITTLIQEAPATVPMEAPRSEAAEFPLKLYEGSPKPKRKPLMLGVAALLLISGAGAYFYFGGFDFGGTGSGTKSVAALGNPAPRARGNPGAHETASPANPAAGVTPATVAKTGVNTNGVESPTENHPQGGPETGSGGGDKGTTELALAEHEKLRFWLDGALVATLGAPERKKTLSE